jgi:hypothetical protein
MTGQDHAIQSGTWIQEEFFSWTWSCAALHWECVRKFIEQSEIEVFNRFNKT